MAFASTDDVAARLGRSLTEAETEAAAFLLEAAQAVIEATVEKTEVKIDPPLPPVLRFVTVEVVCRAMANPSGLSSEQEALGAYSYTERYRSGEAELLLTPTEEMLVRHAVIGQLSGSVRIPSHIDDIFDALVGS